MLNAERQRDYRKRKAQENKTSQESTSTDPTPTPIYTVIIKRMNTFKRIVLVIHLVMPATYLIDYGI
jgi:glucan phosphorylase